MRARRKDEAARNGAGVEMTAQIDAYCERLGPGLWAEPVNLLSNLAFIAVAVWLWPRVAGLPRGRALVALLFAIGVGSGLWHAVARPWAGLVDVLAIAGFVLVYIHAAHRDYWDLGPGPAWAATLATLPVLGAGAWGAAQVPGLAVSAGYWPVVALIAGHALGLRRRLPEVARGLGRGSALLVLSITLRSVDHALCAAVPMGTHFAWHLLNAALLGLMIWVYRRHMLAGRAARR